MAATNSPARNWAFMLGLGICSLAVAGLGVFGWSHSRAPVALIICAGTLCVAAQFVAACCGANFGRHTWRAAWGTRLLLVAGYLVAASFAAYSADQGWMVATSEPHLAAVAQRANERGRIEAEIAEREGYVRIAEGQRAAVRASGPLQTAALQTPYTETIQRNERRLTELRADLEAKPGLPAERARNAFDWAALIAFILWQALEPWLYGAAERGRRPTVAGSTDHRPAQPVAQLTAQPAQPLVLRRLVSWRTVFAGLTGIGIVSSAQIPATAAPVVQPVEQPMVRLPPVEAVEVAPDLAKIANRLSTEEKMGEQRIADTLSKQSGQKISRHQVRVWLGRATAKAAA